MIDISIVPEQILVIDDHEEWLLSLNKIKIQVYNCRHRSLRDLESFIDNLKNPIHIVVINLHILQTPLSKRSDNYGYTLVKDMLEDMFPGIRFLYTSFLRDMDPPEKFNYIDFLHHLNKYHDRE